MTRTLRTAGLALGLALLASGCGDDKSSVESAPNAPASEAPAGKPSAGTPPAADPDAKPGTTVDCEYTARESGAKTPKVDPPSRSATVAPAYATLTTNLGQIVIELDSAAAPCTVHSFVHLAEAGFYADSPCHRILDEEQSGYRNAVVQCGDPSGTGTGGPGYSFEDENLEGAKYLRGVVAMANAGPNTNGSQFFMMFDDSDFSPDYAPFGTILSGVEVLEKVAEGGRKVNPATGADDVPKKNFTIEKVEISDKSPAKKD